MALSQKQAKNTSFTTPFDELFNQVLDESQSLAQGVSDGSEGLLYQHGGLLDRMRGPGLEGIFDDAERLLDMS